MVPIRIILCVGLKYSCILRGLVDLLRLIQTNSRSTNLDLVVGGSDNKSQGIDIPAKEIFQTLSWFCISAIFCQ